MVSVSEDLGDGYRLFGVAMKVEGGYGEFVHVFPAAVLKKQPTEGEDMVKHTRTENAIAAFETNLHRAAVRLTQEIRDQGGKHSDDAEIVYRLIERIRVEGIEMMFRKQPAPDWLKKLAPVITGAEEAEAARLMEALETIRPPKKK